MSGELVLVVDDEPNIIDLARLYLEKEGFRVKGIADGPAALQAVEQLRPAFMVLDVMLPGIDGFEVCRRLRAANNPLPILLLTARDEDVDKIIGLELGADDYLTKPFNPRELAARVKAILRRGEWKPQTTKPMQITDMLIDPARREVSVKDQPVELRQKVFDLLCVLVEHRGLVLSREKLLELVWGYDFYGQTRTVDVHVSHLRKKLAESALQIETVSGIGYKLVG
ncbi:MAG: response regulator transcription factor [Anaerolineales bacterium]|nr:response regulator transcription factor [Anaerolineales bacterium]